MRQAEDKCRQARTDWLKAGAPGEGSAEGDALITAAIHADRGDLVEQVLAGGNILKRMVPIPRGGREIRLHVLNRFHSVKAEFESEMFASIATRYEGWLARRITTNAFEVWTPKHGWLFDGKGRVVHEAAPPRRTGIGREWYGAFLPDGHWVTTDIDETDGQLSFFSSKGILERVLTSAELAPGGDERKELLGWGRSDRDGRGWVVSVGSEEGRATVWVGPEGPARVLKPGERWDLCYPRALGPRGSYWDISVPDDADDLGIYRGAAGHGPGVGYPTYWQGHWPRPQSREVDDPTPNASGFHIVPDGIEVFGFWPGRRSFFVGAESYHPHHEPGGMRARKQNVNMLGEVNPIIDKTWFFEGDGRFSRWVRARRIADAADGKSMLFRVTTDSRVMTLGPDLRVSAMRRFVWADDSTADAVMLWDDWHLGLFIRNGRLVLASWGKHAG